MAGLMTPSINVIVEGRIVPSGAGKEAHPGTLQIDSTTNPWPDVTSNGIALEEITNAIIAIAGGTSVVGGRKSSCIWKRFP